MRLLKYNLLVCALGMSFLAAGLSQDTPSGNKDTISGQVPPIQVDSSAQAADGVKNASPQNEAPGQSLPSLKPPQVYKIFSFYQIFWATVFLIAVYFILKGVTSILNLWAERSTRFRITIKGFIPILRIAGWITVTVVIITGIFQPPMATILAFAASIGVAVGFSSQDILKNIFGGITILFDRPFQVGDKIEIGKYYGEVVEIGLRSTRIVTPDDSMVTVPNAELMNQSLSNSNTGEANCQVVAEIFLPIHIDTARVREIAIEAAQVSRYVYLKKPIAVLFTHEIHERKTYLKMKMKAYVTDIRNEFAFRSDMTEMVIKELISQGILPENY